MALLHNSGYRDFLEQFKVTQLVKNFPAVLKPEGPLPHLQYPAIGPILNSVWLLNLFQQICTGMSPCVIFCNTSYFYIQKLSTLSWKTTSCQPSSTAYWIYLRNDTTEAGSGKNWEDSFHTCLSNYIVSCVKSQNRETIWVNSVNIYVWIWSPKGEVVNWPEMVQDRDNWCNFMEIKRQILKLHE